MSFFEIPEISKKINSDNYLLNSYIHLTKINSVHFLFLLIEIIINIFQEIELFLNDFKIENRKKSRLNFISDIINKFKTISSFIKLFSVIIFMVIIDFLYLFITIKKIKIKNIGIIILVNTLEIILFRTMNLIFLDFFFTIEKVLFIIGCIFLIPHIYLIINNFLYNHLYYFVPKFINYPYDAFSSIFDIILLIIKILLSTAGTTNNSGFGKFCFLIIYTIEIFFTFYFIYKLRNHSYLFIKNSFLNRTRVGLFFTMTIINFFALLFGKREILTTLFFIISISILIIVIIYMNFLYNPYSYIRVKKDAPTDNIFFCLFILSEKNDYDFIFENKIKVHYEECGICDICKKFIKYLNRHRNKRNRENDEEKINLINEENNINNENLNKQLKDLFDIVYEGNNKYFKLIKKIILNYKNLDKEFLRNNSYYYINLSFLIYSDYQKNNFNLSLNERLIFEVLNRENISFIENNESQIKQLLQCNQFLSLSHKVLNKLKDILSSEPNLYKAKKLIDLSISLEEMRDPIYKKNLFTHKAENISNSRNLILICSILYEEIFNTTLNSSMEPLRDNIQPLEDIFHNHSNKTNKLISLSFDLTNRKCFIIRAGKDLASYVSSNLFDLFPLIFKEFQINVFISSILKNFEINSRIDKNTPFNSNNVTNNKFPRYSTKNVRAIIKPINNKNKKEFIEIKVVLSENISSKMYYKLLTLKLTPLFNSENNHFILFDGLYFLHKNTLITLQDFEQDTNAKEILIAVSEPELEKNNEIFSIPFKKYITWQNSQGYEISKISSFNILIKLYTIYLITKKEKGVIKKLSDIKCDINKELKIDDDEDDFQASFNKNSKAEKIQLLEDNTSATSQQTGSSNSNGISNMGPRNKKKNNIYEYGGFSKIKKINIITIFITLILIIVEYLYLSSLKNQTYNNNNSLLEYRDFYKLYFQLFSSTLGVACISANNCINIINIFPEQYFQGNNSFNFTLLVLIQNEISSKKMMKDRNYLINIHKSIGNEKYNELFGKIIDYKKINQNLIQGKVVFNITSLKIQFSEAILVICNSFQALSVYAYNQIFFLNKTIDPFSNINENNKNNSFLTDYQKEFYELILNYKSYYQQFNTINILLTDMIVEKSEFIQVCVYTFLSINTIIILFIGTLMYLYTTSFESILVKIINYINMIMSVKSDNFSFNEIFSKKIEILEAILNFNTNDPVKAVQNLNTMYSKYQQYLTTKYKKISKDTNKKNYKKLMDENKKNELDDIPKNQRIISKRDVKSLGITFKFIAVYNFIIVIIILIYIILLIFWYDYFSKKSNLYALIGKNNKLETSLYRALNAYYLMIFNNYTSTEIVENVFTDIYSTGNNDLFKSFYDDLKLAFNSKIEKYKVSSLYKDFEDISNFTCKNLYDLNIDKINEIKNNSHSMQLGNINETLLRMCEFSKITESNDFRTAYEKHFQYIRNGIVNLRDFTYSGLVNYIMNDGIISRISLFFNSIVIYLLEITVKKPHREAVTNLIYTLNFLIKATGIIFLLWDIILIILVIFFYIPGINCLCNQIFVLKNIFKIYEIQE